jgi:hypothetical protein
MPKNAHRAAVLGLLAIMFFLAGGAVVHESATVDEVALNPDHQRHIFYEKTGISRSQQPLGDLRQLNQFLTDQPHGHRLA